MHITFVPGILPQQKFPPVVSTFVSLSHPLGVGEVLLHNISFFISVRKQASNQLIVQSVRLGSSKHSRITMGWYSLLPAHLSDLETWIARVFVNLPCTLLTNSVN